MKISGYTRLCDHSYGFCEDTDLSALPAAVRPVMRRFAASYTAGEKITNIRGEMSIPSELKEIFRREKIPLADGSFAITCEGGVVTVFAEEREGLLNGCMTFLRLLDDGGNFAYRTVCDGTVDSFRGIKIMMPARQEIQDYRDFVDMMMYFRHNTLMIGVGGAMEYKKHPEINAGWEEYCAFMSEYSGKSRVLQEETFPWRKNSIHLNNGGGSYLTQEEVKGLIAYAEERGIRVIPEVPSTSHCDYLLTRHPELAERGEDPYPDTFCPSNPASYDLLFDVFDEVIEVFHPEVMNVGHDEYYSINICDRCRKRLADVSDIFAEDLTKIHDYLAAKGVKTMFWCDKIMNVVRGGNGYGGALNFVYFGWNVNNKLLGIIPPTWKAREKLPKDILCMNWYWSFGEAFDKELDGFSRVLGNFHGEEIRNFRRRSAGGMGGMCSNWGATSPVYLQRNRIYFSLAYNDRLYWDSSYDDTDAGESTAVCAACFDELFAYRHPRGERARTRYLSVTHRTDATVGYHGFADGIYAGGGAYRDTYLLGTYEITYTDGTASHFDCLLGETLASGDVEWYDHIVAVDPSDGSMGTTSARIEQRLTELATAAVPLLLDGRIFYRTLFCDPHPEKKIASLSFVPRPGAKGKVEIKELAAL